MRVIYTSKGMSKKFGVRVIYRKIRYITFLPHSCYSYQLHISCAQISICFQQIHAIISASSSVKSSKKLRRVLEIILAFGNYLNSSKRGPAYGFKLQSLDTLLDTKSTDKRMCLLHYIVDTVRHKFPELLNFESELMYIDKAAVGK